MTAVLEKFEQSIDRRPNIDTHICMTFSSVFSTCVGCRLWLGSLSSWAPIFENQVLFINPGSVGNIILEVGIRCGVYSRKYAAICCSLIDMRKVNPHCGRLHLTECINSV